MPIFRRRVEQEVSGPEPEGPEPESSRDPLSRYADSVTVVVRHTPKQFEADPDYEVASVARFTAGGEVPAEDLREDVLRWLLDEGFTAHNEIAFERRHVNIGASGAEVAIVLSLLGGAAGGLTQEAVRFIAKRLSSQTENLTRRTDSLDSLESLRYGVSRAFDIRPSDLALVEQRESDLHHAAVFEDQGGRFYGVRLEGSILIIRRLQRGDW